MMRTTAARQYWQGILSSHNCGKCSNGGGNGVGGHRRPSSLVKIMNEKDAFNLEETVAQGATPRSIGKTHKTATPT